MSADADKIPRSRHGCPWFTAAIAIAVLILHVFSPNPVFEYDRAKIEAGELWRFWSAHLVHFSASHLWWNLAILVPAGALAERAAPRRARWFYALSPLIIGIALHVFDPQLHRYAGLSALGAGALALLAFTHLGRRADEARWFWWGVLVLLTAKIGIELFVQTPLFARFGDASIKPVPLAHVAGFACAALVHGTRRRFHV